MADSPQSSVPEQSDPVSVQESPIFTYISSLSPIKPVMPAPAPQSFSGLNRPPLVFTSSRVNSASGLNLCRRRLLVAGSSGQNENSKHSDTVDNESALFDRRLSHPGKAVVSNTSLDEEDGSLSRYGDKLLAGVARMDCRADTDSSGLHHNPQLVNVSVDSDFNMMLESLENKNAEEIAIRLPASYSEQTREDQQVKKPVDLEQSDKDLQGRYDVPPTSCPKVDQNQPDLKRCRHHFEGVQQKEDYPVKVHRPFGIGLHLNRIVNSMRCSSATSFWKASERASSSTIANNSVANMCNDQSKICSISTNPVKGISANSDDNKHDGHTSVVANTASSFPTYSVKALNDNGISLATDDQSNLHDLRTPKTENASSEDLYPPSSKTIKNALDKRCNCRKTQCLKLYCDCFAAGAYCTDLCTCQGCFNATDYEDTLEGTRQQIESRNPHAFLPKIQHVDEAISNTSGDDGIHFTHSSVRHKRGCNCKKSKCLKKYCECYQANVGCSDGCRCEGCANVNGRKEDYVVRKDLIFKQDTDEAPDSSADEILEMVTQQEGFLHNDPSIPHNLTPIAPSFLVSNYAEGAASSRYCSGRYLTSPESEPAMVATYGVSTGSTFLPNNHGVDNEMMSIVGFGMQSDPVRYPTNQFSPRCNGFGNISLPSALPNPETWVNSTNAQIFSENGQVPTARSLHWHNTPIGPINQFGENKVLRWAGGVQNMADNDAPQILTESLTPPNAVKVVSPSKKRVSTPRSHETVLSGSSSGGVMTGRKYILQAVPSFPPLTPCLGSKSLDGHTGNDSQS